MIGAIDEAKKKNPPSQAVGKTEPGAKPLTKANAQPSAAKAEGKSDPESNAELKPQREVAHAGADAHAS